MAAPSEPLALPEGCRTALALDSPTLDTDAMFRANRDLRRLYLAQLAPGNAIATPDPRLRRIPTPRDGDWPSALRTAFQEDILYFAEGRVGLLFTARDFMAQPDTCNLLAHAFKEFTQSVLSGVALRATRGWHILANSLLNLPRLSGEGVIGDLIGAGRGRPAVVVGAGPSLDHTAPALRDLRDRGVVIACDAACSTLAHMGIVPDLIVTTDDSEKVWRHFARLPDAFRAVPLVALLHSAWPVIRHYPGPLFAGRSRAPSGAAINRLTGLTLPEFDSGQSVGHAALDIAALLDCAPLILTGFDLGYRDDRFHPVHMQMPYFHHHPPPAENLLTVQGNDGRPVKTDLSMLLYLREFERRIARLRVPVINGTEGGARIEGAPCRPLRDTLADHPARRDPIELAARRAPARPDLRAFRERVQTAVSSLAEDVRREGERLERGDGDPAGDRPFPVLEQHREAIELMSDTENLAQLAEFQFAWEDVRRRPETGAAYRKAAQTHLHEVGMYADLALALARMDTDRKNLPARAIRSLATLAGADHPAWQALLRQARNEGMELHALCSDPSDIPGLWNEILDTQVDGMVCLNGAAWPAVWGMPGLPCWDLRTEPPSSAPVIPEQWLPGYTAVCPSESLRNAWRETIPNDRTVVGMGDVRFATPPH